MLSVFYVYEFLFFGGSITFEGSTEGRPEGLVGDNPLWPKALGLKQVAENRLGSGLISSALHQDIQDGSRLIHCSPQGILLAFGRNNHLIEWLWWE